MGSKIKTDLKAINSNANIDYFLSKYGQVATQSLPNMGYISLEKCENNIKIDVEETECENVYRI
jgi:hypothetical protein